MKTNYVIKVIDGKKEYFLNIGAEDGQKWLEKDINKVTLIPDYKGAEDCIGLLEELDQFEESEGGDLIKNDGVFFQICKIFSF